MFFNEINLSHFSVSDRLRMGLRKGQISLTIGRQRNEFTNPAFTDDSSF